MHTVVATVRRGEGDGEEYIYDCRRDEVAHTAHHGLIEYMVVPSRLGAADNLAQDA